MKNNLLLTLLLFLAFPSFSQNKIYVQNLRNWLFVNLNNPMFIDLKNIPKDKISIIAHSCKVSTIKSNGHFSITPSRRGNILLKVYRKLKQDSTLIWEGTFSVRCLPPPTAIIGKSENKEMSKNTFLAQKGISVPLINYGISISFPIESYTLIITRKDKLVLLENFEGNQFKPEMIKKLKTVLEGNERLFFTNIKIKSSFHKSKIVNSIEIKLKK